MSSKIKLLNIILFLFYVGFATDSLSAILVKAQGEYNNISFISRATIEFIFIFLLARNNKYKPIFITLIFFGLSFFGMFISVINETMPVNDLLKNLIYLNKILYFFILSHVIVDFFSHDEQKAFIFFEFAYIMFIITILCGVFFQIQIFQAYPQELRFGYKGLIVTQNEAVGVLIIGLFYYVTKFEQSRRLKDYFIAFLLVICGFLTGAKSSIVIIPIIFFILNSYLFLKSRKIRLVSTMILLVLFLFIYYILSKLLENTYRYIEYFYDSGNSLLSIVLTGRDYKVSTLFENIMSKNYAIYNFLFGGFNFSNFGTEMDIFDVFQFFGILGGILFYLVYFNTFLSHSGKHKLIYLFIAIWFILSTLNGHLIYNAVIPIYLSIMLLRLKYVQKNITI